MGGEEGPAGALKSEVGEQSSFSRAWSSALRPQPTQLLISLEPTRLSFFTRGLQPTQA